MSDVAYLDPGRRPRSRRLLRAVVGDALRRSRHRQRRTLADVARAARVSVPYLSEVERGRKEASSEVLAAVCGALRVSLSDLLTEVGRELAKDTTPVIRLDPARPLDTTDRLENAGRRRAAPAAPGQRVAAPPVRRFEDPVLLAA